MEAKNSEEIDLFEVFASIAWAVRKNYLLLAILTIAGFAAGFASSFVVKKQYESKMVISSDILTLSYVERIMGTLNELIREDNEGEVQRRLKIAQDVSSNLVSLSVEMLVKNKQDAPENEKNNLVITARTLNSDVLPALQAGILQCLMNHDYVRVRVDQRKEYYSTLLKEVEKEIASLEELKGKISSGEFFQGIKGNISFDPTTVNSKIIELSKSKLEYLNNLQLVESVEVIEPFTPHYKPVTGRMVRSSVLAGLVGLMLGFLVIAIRSLDKAIKRNEKQNA